MSDTRRIIRDGAIVVDEWSLVPTDATAQALPTGKIIVPLSIWRAAREAILARNLPVGIWLDSHDDPAAIANDLAQFAIIAVNFPKFTDGRGYSIATLLRSRYGFRGELRAVGDVLRDQLFYMRRAGFNSFALRADKNIVDALGALRDFSENYQSDVNQPVPLFRRRVFRGPLAGSHRNVG